MKLSAPIDRLKRRAKTLARLNNIALHAALDRVALTEGYARWSLLVARNSGSDPTRRVFEALRHGELLMIAARPGQGKTLFTLDLIRHAVEAGRHGAFFSLEWTNDKTREHLAALRTGSGQSLPRIELHDSDAIDADYIATRLESCPTGTLAAIDYLQVLDQCRGKPPLAQQIRTLRSFARARQINVIITAQISRFFDAGTKSCPDLRDIRLPNAVDLSLFDKACFLHGGRVEVGPVSQ